jgi:glutamate dehydrogenase (NAD(P)+)
MALGVDDVKCAAVNLPYSGAKGGIRCERKARSRSSADTSEIGIIIGPQRNIPAPDVNTNSRSWPDDGHVLDEHRHDGAGVVTGKPFAS